METIGKGLLFLCALMISSTAFSAGEYWASGKITEYHVYGSTVVVELNNVDDPQCQGYNWYGDYKIDIPDPAQSPHDSMIASVKIQALFDHFKNNRSIMLYVTPSGGYCNIITVTYGG